MVGYLSFLLVILVADFRCTAYQYRLKPKFFGPNNRFRCNCKGNALCNATTGHCGNVGCSRGFIGVSCQHLSVETVTKNMSKVHNNIIDHDDSTCHPLMRFRGKLIYSLKQVVHFVWIYVHVAVQRPSLPYHLLLKRRGREMRADLYERQIDTKSFLIKSRNVVLYDELRLTDLPNYTCTVDISIGRNVAVKEKAYASAQKSNRYNPSLAVDGANTIKMYQNPGCFYSGPKRKPPVWWMVELPFESWISLVRVLSTLDKKSLFHFTVKAYTKDWALVKAVVDQSDRRQQEYFIGVASTRLVGRVKVVLPRSTKPKADSLVLCEVAVFGEYKCPDNVYGLYCTKRCRNCDSEACDPDWGCAKGGCKPRWMGDDCDIDCRYKWGINCTKKCPRNCGSRRGPNKRGHCYHDNGHCIHGCLLGYNQSASRKCKTKCRPPYYGKNCEAKCFQCAVNKTLGVPRCDHATGKCKDGCGPDFPGDSCECPFRFGENCEYMCSDACAGLGDCNSRTGACLQGCKRGYYPPNCTVMCAEGEFDYNCNKTCTKCAKNETTNAHACDPISGECFLGCAERFHGGIYCENIMVFGDVGRTMRWLHVIWIVILVVILLYKSLVTRVDDEEEEEEAETEQPPLKAVENDKNEEPLQELGDLSRDPERVDPEGEQPAPKGRDPEGGVPQVSKKHTLEGVPVDPTSAAEPGENEDVDQQKDWTWASIFAPHQAAAESEPVEESSQVQLESNPDKSTKSKLPSSEPKPKEGVESKKSIPHKVVGAHRPSSEPKPKEVDQPSKKAIPDKVAGAHRPSSEPKPKEVDQPSKKPIPDKVVGAHRPSSEPKPKEVDQPSKKPIPDKVAGAHRPSSEPKPKEGVESKKPIPDKVAGAHRPSSEPKPKEVDQPSKKPIADKVVGAKLSSSKPMPNENPKPLLNKSKKEEHADADKSSSVDDS